MTTRTRACQFRPVLLPGFSSALASFGLIKKQPQAFWCITPARLTVAVLGQAAGVGEEPLLVACAGLEAARAWGHRPAFVPGLLETACAVGAFGLGHWVALGGGLSRLVEADEAGGGQAGLRVAVDGPEGVWAEVDREVLETLTTLFSRSRLRLHGVDSADCALANLSGFLGQADQSSRDPLAAVTVVPECEQAATSLGRHLAVPVGLALGRFGCLDGRV